VPRGPVRLPGEGERCIRFQPPPIDVTGLSRRQHPGKEEGDDFELLLETDVEGSSRSEQECLQITGYRLVLFLLHERQEWLASMEEVFVPRIAERSNAALAERAFARTAILLHRFVVAGHEARQRRGVPQRMTAGQPRHPPAAGFIVIACAEVEYGHRGVTVTLDPTSAVPPTAAALASCVKKPPSDRPLDPTDPVTAPDALPAPPDAPPTELLAPDVTSAPN
jgi:hypothetical protein